MKIKIWRTKRAWHWYCPAYTPQREWIYMWDPKPARRAL